MKLNKELKAMQQITNILEPMQADQRKRICDFIVAWSNDPYEEPIPVKLEKTPPELVGKPLPVPEPSEGEQVLHG